jgi:hypothetical protein
MNAKQEAKVTTRWLVENEWVAKRQASEDEALKTEEFTAAQVAEAIHRDKGGVLKALRELVDRKTLVEAGRGRFALAGAKKVRKAREPKGPGKMDARIKAIEDLLRRHPDGMTREALADALGDNVGDVRPGKSGSTTLWKAAKDGRIVRDGKAWKLAAS